ncbi:MAG: pyrroloquinoline quinone biosynthesis peptide chaperone PqqD [Pelagibacterales bacterium]|jgi:pyrroloquinoline quinone biosynthesis protein D|nr:pyrroloquinoline quinone biosynthesis peptide chaperone PqqD [Pelagibacterales bacterium]MBT7077451.1 pyrroloquinoline quinone biosynthesis peptide chaperone PqqD [Pelagibacterales bacterium]
MLTPIILKNNDIPKFSKSVKFKFDVQRNKWIINAPERVIELNESAAEILQLINGKISIKTITNKIKNKYVHTPEDLILNDIIKLLQLLADKRFVIK